MYGIIRASWIQRRMRFPIKKASFFLISEEACMVRQIRNSFNLKSNRSRDSLPQKICACPGKTETPPVLLVSASRRERLWSF
jgi:hypothetical protein